MAQKRRNEHTLSSRDKANELFKQSYAALMVGKKKFLFYWSELPKANRIAVIAVAVFLTFLVLLPSSDEESGQRNSVKLDLNLPPEAFLTSEAKPDHLIKPDAVKENTSVVADTVVIEDNSAPLTVASQTKSNEWFSYQVKHGDTLASIFRAQNLPILDLYAITAIEGDDKPLSKIKPGEVLRLRRSMKGELDLVQIEKANEPEVVFFRATDGNFRRR